jgi:hypothetical protein
MTEKHFTDSTQVKTIWYNEEAKEMEVLFMVNKRYVYYGVSLEVWKQATSAESIGKFINSEIKWKYLFKLL